MTCVLVVDDKPENRYYLVALLRSQGIEAEEAGNGVEALAAARRRCPDLVMSDLLMPVMDGYTLLRHWKSDESLRQAPFIVYTATYTEPEDQKLALELGADAFLLKPAEPEVLLARVAEVLARRATSAPAPTALSTGVSDELLTEYSATLIRKLEEKTIQLEEANRALKRDIVERERAERALRESELRFREIAENIQEVFWISDPAKRHMIYVSPAYERIWGRTCDSLYREPKAWLEAVHPDDRGRVAAALVRQVEGTYDETYRIVRPDGSERWIRDRAFPVLNEAGDLYRIVGTAEDITDRKLAEDALQRRAEEQLALAAQLEAERTRLLRAQSVAKLGSWETDLKTLAVIWSAQTHRIFETDPAAFVPTHEAFLSFVHPDDREPVDAAFRASVQDGSEGTVEHRIVLADGRIKHLQERWDVVSEGGAAVRAIGTCQDITERVKLEERLRRAQRLESIGHLTGGVAHDFNNLLTVIIGNAEMLEEDSRAEGSQRAALAGMVLHAAQRGADLTQRLLAFARKQPLAPQPVNLRKSLAELEPMLRRTLGEHVEITVTHAPQMGSALVDPSQLDHAILNLCLNARDAMPDGGQLHIETKEIDLTAEQLAGMEGLAPGRYAQVAISDTGMGIAPEHLEHIFEPFFTTKEPGKGTGLGLATTYGFIRQSGGHVAVQSEVGRGTTFKLFLPLAQQAQPAAGIAAPAVTTVTGTETILLVEDNDLVRRYACAQLGALGYAVIEARNGLEALAVLKGTQQVHLLFTDVVMPGMSGPQLAQAAAALRPSLKVLYTSGYTEDAMSGKRLIEPGTPLLMKPYRPRELAVRIRAALDG
jgi:PAS domain S-box-containing protein